MLYNRKAIQRQIITERKMEEKLNSLTLNEWITPGLKDTIRTSSAEARNDASLSWEDLCNPEISSWTLGLKKAKGGQSTGLFGGSQWNTTGKPDKVASTAMHMAWKSKDFPGKMINREDFTTAYKKGQIKATWASQFIAGHCHGTAFAKVNEIKGKVTPDEEGGLKINGEYNHFISSYVSNPHVKTTKFFSYGDKYVLMWSGNQRFAIMTIRDKNGEIVNTPEQFAQLASDRF